MKKRLLICLLILTLVAVPSFATACEEEEPPPAQEEEPPPAQEEEEEENGTVEILKIGCTLPLNKTTGTAAKKWWDVIIPAFNEAGGVVVNGQRYHIELIIEDDKYTAEGGRAAAEKLIYVDNVKYIIGVIGGASAAAMLSVTEPNKVILIHVGGGEDVIQPENHYGLFMGPGGPATAPSNWAQIARICPDVQTYIFTAPDNETGRRACEEKEAVALAVMPGLVAAGPAVFYPQDETDFGSWATKIKSYNPDLVCYEMNPDVTSFALQIKELYNAGWRGVTFCGRPYTPDEVVAVAGLEAYEGTIVGVSPLLIEPPINALAENYIQAYIEEYGELDITSAEWLCFFQVFIDAIKKADSLETDDIMAALPGLSGDSFYGQYITIKRPDVGNDRYVSCLYASYRAVISAGEYVFPPYVLDCYEILEAIEAAVGFEGQWQ
jgi:branched-chain amino acid transport system substrate-binding protein